MIFWNDVICRMRFFNVFQIAFFNFSNMEFSWIFMNFLNCVFLIISKERKSWRMIQISQVALAPRLDSWNDKLLILVDYAGGVISSRTRHTSSISCETNAQAQHGWKTNHRSPQEEKLGTGNLTASLLDPNTPILSYCNHSWDLMSGHGQKIWKRNKHLW